jgi:hypothetical protein
MHSTDDIAIPRRAPAAFASTLGLVLLVAASSAINGETSVWQCRGYDDIERSSHRLWLAGEVVLRDGAKFSQLNAELELIRPNQEKKLPRSLGQMSSQPINPPRTSCLF